MANTNEYKGRKLSPAQWREREMQESLDRFFDPDFSVEIFEECERACSRGEHTPYYNRDGHMTVTDYEAHHYLHGHQFDERAEGARIIRTKDSYPTMGDYSEDSFA